MKRDPGHSDGSASTKSAAADDLIFAGVVTHNPDLVLLKDVLAAISPQVHVTLIFDNGSRDPSALAALAATNPEVRLYLSAKNCGIATALNLLVQKAKRQGASWLLTLDQDSIAGPDMVWRMRAAATPDTPIITPFIVDRNKLSVEHYHRLAMPEIQYYTHAAWRGAITSGTLMRLDVVQEVDGFDDALFIDYVDYDFNQRVLLKGYRIARVNRVYLSHEVGKAAPTRLWVPRRQFDGSWRFERFYSFGHSAERCYYKARNRVIFTRKYTRLIGLTNEGIWQIPQQVVLTVLFEDHRWRKLRAFIRGSLDGLNAPVSRPRLAPSPKSR